MCNYEVVPLITCLQPLIIFFLCSVIQEKYFSQESDGEETQILPNTQPSRERGNYDKTPTLFSGDEEEKQAKEPKGDCDAGKGIPEECGAGR